jgi:pyruvate/2-oxoglutarate dehydrogenase complex dihydrolipoamide acyltransferase (E2) component
MAETIIMPKFGLTMEEGTVTNWFKKPGDSVKQGEKIADIETEKVVTELEASISGIFAKILVAEGETVAVGTPIALLAVDAAEAEALK